MFPILYESFFCGGDEEALRLYFKFLMLINIKLEL